MSSLQPECVLWKKRDKTKLKNVCTVEVPAGKTLRLHAGDPTTTGSATLIRYDVITDTTQETIHTEIKTEEFPWDGLYHEVTTQIISGPLISSYTDNTNNNNYY
ncbi:MAG: hypothetical protein GXO89_07590 [Chlorobi bacterium]|nr:hypothetical protein [Chlorobiota bacterium]